MWRRRFRKHPEARAWAGEAAADTLAELVRSVSLEGLRNYLALTRLLSSFLNDDFLATSFGTRESASGPLAANRRATITLS
jgi:hypothetical protein